MEGLRYILVSLLTLVTVLNAVTTLHVYWTDNENDTVTFVDNSKGYYPLKLCLSSSSDVLAHLTLRGDSFGTPKYYETILRITHGRVCKDVLIYFDKKHINTERSYDIIINAKNTNGIYADIEVNGVKLEKLGYLRVLGSKGSNLGGCVKVTSNVTHPFIGERVKFSASNSCTAPLIIEIKADIENFADFELAKLVLSQGGRKEIEVAVPKLVAVNLLGLFGGPTVAVRGLYVSANGTTIYYIPVYDYFTYYIKPNVKASWYSNGRAVKAVGKGETVTGCVVLPDIVPRTKVPPLEASLKVVEDLSFAPDEVVAKKNFVINRLPFKVCVSFISEKQWNTRGYKLVLEVVENVKVLKGKIPLTIGVEARPELSVR